MEVLQAGLRNSVELGEQEGAGESLAIYFSEPTDGPATRWRFRVRAVMPLGVLDLGEFTTTAPDGNRIPFTRCVAVANCPGATSWRVEVEAISGAGRASCELRSSRVSTGAPGLTAIDRRYGAVGIGTTVFPRGQRIKSWNVFTTQAVATVTWAPNGPPVPIPVPQNGSVGGKPDGLLEGVTFTYVNCDGALVEYAEG